VDQIKPRRRSIRLPGYDYSQPGAYFITVCTHRRALLFGRIKETEMLLHRIGTIVAQCWQRIPQHFPTVGLDQWIVMPNHLHGILIISDVGVSDDAVGARHASPLPAGHAPPLQSVQLDRPTPRNLTVATIIGSFKSAATKHVNAARRSPGAPVWQRNYYEHIIRTPAEFEKTRKYIYDNPMLWDDDPENV